MNVILLTGRLLRDIELKTIPNSDNMIGKSAIAIDRPYKKGKEKESDILNIIIWGKTATFAAEYSGKGKMVEIVGRIQTGSYEAKDGTKRYTTDVVVTEFKPLEWVKKDEVKKSGYNDFEPNGAEENLPF